MLEIYLNRFSALIMETGQLSQLGWGSSYIRQFGLHPKPDHQHFLPCHKGPLSCMVPPSTSPQINAPNVPYYP